MNEEHLGDKKFDYRQFYINFVAKYNQRFPARAIHRMPSGKNWFTLDKAEPSGSGYHLSFTQDGRFRVELAFQNTDRSFNKLAFDRLHNQMEAIETELGTPLSWDRRDSLKRSQISAYYPGLATITDSEAMRIKYLEWAVDMADRFRKVFDLRINSHGLS